MAHGEKFIKIVPTYLNCTNWFSEFQLLSDVISTIPYDHLLLVGDLNARIGHKQIIPFNTVLMNKNLVATRRSEDTICNANGKKLLELCDNFSLTILNGRFTGDLEGKFSFMSQGKSTIDYAVCGINVLNIMKSFSIDCLDFSDHYPVIVEFSIPSMICKNNTLMPKVHWNANLNQFYKINEQ